MCVAMVILDVLCVVGETVLGVSIVVVLFVDKVNWELEVGCVSNHCCMDLLVECSDLSV